MDKAQIRAEITAAEEALATCRSDLKKEEQFYNDVVEFSSKCTERETSFSLSMKRRRNRVAGISGLVKMVRSAKIYSERMSDLLNGVEYQAVTTAISNLKNSVAEEKRRSAGKIQELEDEIRRLQARIRSLQYQYDTYQEEEEDG